MNSFVRMKAGLLFTILVGAFILIMPINIVARALGLGLFHTPVGMLVCFAVYYFWFWSMGVCLNRRVPERIRPRLHFFYISMVYIVLLFLYHAVIHSTVFLYVDLIIRFLIAIPLYITSMICSFYVGYFISKNLVMAERKGTVGFQECVGPFLMLWMYLIGLWVLQPRVNRVCMSEVDMQQELETDAV